jgi:hypothetical protein
MDKSASRPAATRPAASIHIEGERRKRERDAGLASDPRKKGREGSAG